MLNLPGIRMDDALIRMQNDEDKLVRATHQLIIEVNAKLATLRALANKGDFDQLHTEVHALKGVASVVSAIKLYHMLADLCPATSEGATNVGERLEAIENYINELEASLPNEGA